MVRRTEMLMRIFLLLVLVWSASHALKNDSEQVATLDADEIEFDFKSGERIYRGHVVFSQGSIRITCDLLTTHYDDDGELKSAVCEGAPGTFRQRPEGSDHDVMGEALEIILEQADRLVIMKSRARIVQENSSMSGNLITYDLDEEKAVAKGGSLSGPKSEEEESQVGNRGQSSRPRIVIQPRKPDA